MAAKRSSLAGSSRAFSLAVAGLLLASLAALAALQWRWIGEVSALDRQRLHSSLIGAGTRFTEDFDREVTRAFLTFLPADGSADPRERVISQLERWQDEAPYPALISELYLAGGPAPAPGPGGELARLNPAERRFEERPWPRDLAAAAQLRRARSPAGPALQRFLLPEVPALRVPLAPAELAAVHDFRRRAETEAEVLETAAPRGQLILRFDAATIAEQILPELTRRHFGSAEGTDYAVLVTSANDPDRVFFRSDADLALSDFREADVQLELFSLRLFPDLHDPAAGATIRWRFGREREGAGSGRHRDHQPREEAGAVVHRRSGEPPTQAADGDEGGPPSAGRLRRLRLDGAGGDGGWVLAVKRRDGSLEQAVAAIRRRNLAVSSGILAVLLVTTGTLMVTAQRARRLARQQIEFVAGVTHELHTPLTAIRSAGENLADGVVAGPEQVRRYGRLIEGEGRRLSGMVGQLLELAGIQSGRRNYRMEPLAVAAIVEGALADSRWLLAEARIEVEREIAGGLPPVNGDLAALKRALQNLIENAVKYGGEARWLRVEARLGAGGGRGDVEIAVADRGPGIPASDLPHLFEPFYRGSAASSANAPGSGLGLALVRHVAEAHGGGVRVEGSAAGSGATGSVFVLHLPAAESGRGGAASPTPAA